MDKEKMLPIYVSPQIERSEVYLEHVIADSGTSGSNAQKVENPGTNEGMDEGYYTGDFS